MARREAIFEKEQNRILRVGDAENERRNKNIWTNDVVEYGENLQAFMKQWNQDAPSYIDYIPSQCRKNQAIAKTRLEAKRAKRRGGLPVPNFPPLLQLRWFHGYQHGGFEKNKAATRTSNMVGCSKSTPISHPHVHK